MKAGRYSVLLAVVLGFLGTLPMVAAGATNSSTSTRIGSGGGSGEGEDSGDGKGTKITPPPSGQKSGVELPGFNLPPGLREQLGQGVLEALSRYQAASEEYLKNRRDLSDKLRAATSDQRKELLERLRASRDHFLTDTRDLRTEINNQLTVEREKLKKKPGSGRPGGRP